MSEDLHIWPTDTTFGGTKRWNWTLGHWGAGAASTLGYPTPEVAEENARWQEIDFGDVILHKHTAEQERRAAMWRLDNPDADA